MSTFDRADTYTKIVDIVSKKLGIDSNRIHENSTFQDLGADSLDMMEIIMRLEEVFGVEIKDDDVQKLETLSQVVDYVNKIRTK